MQLSWFFLRTCLSFSVDVRRSGGRQLRVPLEGPPGVFAPVVEQRAGGRAGERVGGIWGSGGGAAVSGPFYLTKNGAWRRRHRRAGVYTAVTSGQNHFKEIAPSLSPLFCKLNTLFKKEKYFY